MRQKESPFYRFLIRARIFKRLRSPGIDSKESIPPSNITLFVVTAPRLHKLMESIPWNRFLGSLNVYSLGLSVYYLVA
jgi:hypothetical protein